MQHQNAQIFLAELGPIAELTAWVTAYQQNLQRFTFSEAEVLQAQWEQGEDILLREDSRFQEVILPDQLSSGQWMLSSHILANQRLYESLLDEEWDGENLSLYLQQLDQQSGSTAFHVFCRADTRFTLVQSEAGYYHVRLSQPSENTHLSAEQRQALDCVAEQLVAAFPQQRRAPWTISELLEQVKHVASDLPLLETLLAAELTQWLRQRKEWVRVGRDLWLPQQHLPSPVPNRRYAVLPVNVEQSAPQATFLELIEANEQSTNEAQERESQDTTQVRTPQQLSTQSTWKVTLHTRHLNEGYIPVPPDKRSLYPRKHNSAGIVMLPGLWFEDASHMTIWLDMAHHRLYGPDVMDQLAFLDAGTIIEASWSHAGLTLRLVGQDPNVFEEEARLIDLSELAHTRSTLLESYRASLRVLLTSVPQGKTFANLYLELCQRQQHKPSRPTIRTILSSSPEFRFDTATQTWKLVPHIAEEVGASALRKVIVAARHVDNGESELPQEALSLTGMLARNRQQLKGLRSLYGQRSASRSS